VKPIRDMETQARKAVRYLLVDIDDTLTVGGKLPAASYEGMWLLHDRGVTVIPVTGRPAGWCDMICRQWPVGGVVGENGAFAFYLDGDHLVVSYHPEAPEPQANAERLHRIAEDVLARVPGTRWASDQFARQFDVAIDFREEEPRLNIREAERIKSIFEDHGATAKISSIHVNAWFGTYDKVSMSKLFLRNRFGVDVDQPVDNRMVMFCGDSPNDEPMFRAFANSVAVANIDEFAPAMKHLPQYITSESHAAGFRELVDVLIS
jgi:HAD superfamily hydrolase (TIGR01484 family)